MAVGAGGFSPKENACWRTASVGKSGRSDWIRTSDPLLPKQVRYQTAPRSDAVAIGQSGRLGKPNVGGARGGQISETEKPREIAG